MPDRPWRLFCALLDIFSSDMIPVTMCVWPEWNDALGIFPMLSCPHSLWQQPRLAFFFLLCNNVEAFFWELYLVGSYGMPFSCTNSRCGVSSTQRDHILWRCAWLWEQTNLPLSLRALASIKLFLLFYWFLPPGMAMRRFLWLSTTHPRPVNHGVCTLWRWRILPSSRLAARLPHAHWAAALIHSLPCLPTYLSDWFGLSMASGAGMLIRKGRPTRFAVAKRQHVPCSFHVTPYNFVHFASSVLVSAHTLVLVPLDFQIYFVLVLFGVVILKSNLLSTCCFWVVLSLLADSLIILYNKSYMEQQNPKYVWDQIHGAAGKTLPIHTAGMFTLL